MFARRMKQAMIDQGIAQSVLSDMTGIGRSSISQYLSGKNKPGQKHLSKIAEALNVAEAWLSGEIEEETTIGKYTNLQAICQGWTATRETSFRICGEDWWKQVHLLHITEEVHRVHRNCGGLKWNLTSFTTKIV